MEHLWIYTSIILAIVVLAKILSTKTKTVDVLWLIIFGAIAVNFGILPKENMILEAIGDWVLLLLAHYDSYSSQPYYGFTQIRNID